MLHDRNLRGKALKALKSQSVLEDFQEILYREAKVSSIPSNKTTIFGEESWYYEYQKGLSTKPEAQYKMCLHSHPLGNPILPSSADLANEPKLSSIAQIEPGKALSICTYQSSGPATTIFIAFFPINAVKQNLEVGLDKPRIIRFFKPLTS